MPCERLSLHTSSSASSPHVGTMLASAHGQKGPEKLRVDVVEHAGSLATDDTARWPGLALQESRCEYNSSSALQPQIPSVVSNELTEPVQPGLARVQLGSCWQRCLESFGDACKVLDAEDVDGSKFGPESEPEPRIIGLETRIMG